MCTKITCNKKFTRCIDGGGEDGEECALRGGRRIVNIEDSQICVMKLTSYCCIFKK